MSDERQVDIDYEIEFRKWFEDNVNDDDQKVKSSMYRPMYIAWLAGAEFACRSMRRVHQLAADSG